MNTSDRTSSGEEGEKQPLLKPVKIKDVPVHKGYGARHTFCIMAFLGCFNIFTLRYNMSVAIVAMTNGTTSQSNSSINQECPDHDLKNANKTSQESEFDWDEAEQGFILSSFFYGYIITQIPGGFLAEKLGGKQIYGFAVLVTAILTLLTPLLAHVGVWALVIVRVVQGLAEGVTFPVLFAMQGKWTPAQERTIIPAFTSAGASLGNVVCLPLCGYLSSTNLFGGWPANFYVFGIAACVWWIFWQLLIHDTPADHPRISPEEKNYIEATAGSKRNYSTPWKALFTSSAVWALNICRFTQSWGLAVLLNSIPSYMNKVQKFDITEDGLLMALPNSTFIVFMLTAGWFSDFLLKKKVISVSALRKFLSAIGMIVSAICYPLITFARCDHYVVVILLTVANGILGFSVSAALSNVLDIGNNFAGTLMGIANLAANLSSVASPYVVGLITNHNDTMHQWQKVFYISAGMNVFGVFIFTLFGKGTSEKWNESTKSITVIIQKPDDEKSNTESCNKDIK